MPERIFYIKEVGGAISLSHLPTHTFINSYDSREEVAQALKEWDEKGERNLWEFLIEKRSVKIPKKNASILSNTKDDKDGEAHWYSSVWKPKTDKFFEQYPEAEIKWEEPIPRELIRDIRTEHINKFDSASNYREEPEEETKPKKIIRKPQPEPEKKKIIKKPEPKQEEKPEPKKIKKPEKKKKRPKLKKKIKIVDSVDPF